MNKQLIGYFLVFISAIFFLSCGQITGYYPYGTTGGGNGYGGSQSFGCSAAGAMFNTSWEQNINSVDYQIIQFSAQNTYTKESQSGIVSGKYKITDQHIKFNTSGQIMAAKFSIDNDILTLEFTDGDIQKYYKL